MAGSSDIILKIRYSKVGSGHFLLLKLTVKTQWFQRSKYLTDRWMKTSYLSPFDLFLFCGGLLIEKNHLMNIPTKFVTIGSAVSEKKTDAK
jgi:hypothetical protein